MLKCIEQCCREGGNAKRFFEWKEKGRYYRVENNRNEASKYLSSVIDGEDKKHKNFIPEGRRLRLIGGWHLLVEKLRELGIKGTEEGRKVEKEKETSSNLKEENAIEGIKRGGGGYGSNFAEMTNKGRDQIQSTIWIDVGESLHREAMGSLRFCLVGSWENMPESYPTMREVEGWARTAWRLEGGLMVAFMNQDLFLMEFDFPEEAKRVLNSGRRWLRGGSVKLEWWSPEAGNSNNQ